MTVEFRSKKYLNGNKKIAAFITGFNGKIAHFQKAIEALQKAGYDVIAYEYATELFTTGEPENFVNLIEDIEKDFDAYARGYEWRRYFGVSMGAAIGINLQRRSKQPTEPGVFGAAGTHIAKLVFRNPFFRSSRKVFERNGYNEKKVADLWSEQHKLPKTPFVVVVGRIDYFAKYRDAINLFRKLNGVNPDIKIVTKKSLGHSGLLKWFNNHLEELL